MQKPDVNKPVENPKLLALMADFNSAREANMGGSELHPKLEAVAEELAMRSFLLAVIRLDKTNLQDNGNGTATFKKESQISFEMTKSSDGTMLLPVYTDWNALRAGECYKGNDVSTLILSFDDMAAITAGKAGIVINMFTDMFVLNPQTVFGMKQHKDALTQGYSKQVIKEGTQITLGEPANYPQQMVDAITAHAKKNKSINKIWLKLLMRGQEQSFLLTVEFNGDQSTVFKGIADAGTKYLPQGLFLDMVPFNSDLGQKASAGEPFYVRKKGLFG